MITQIQVDLALLSFEKQYSYIKDLPLFKNEGLITFSEGLNVIFASNGAGKTTMMEMLAKATHCREWGNSCITRQSLQNEDFIRSITEEERNTRKGYIPFMAKEKIFHVSHDGQPVVFCDPRYIVGGFNSDDSHHFGYEYLEAHKDEHIKVKGSTGNKNKHRMALVNDVLNGVRSIDKIEVKGIAHAADCNDLTNLQRYSVQAVNYKMLEASVEKGQKTVLIDEPESALDLKSRIKWFRELERKVKAQNLQVILITHSELALTFKNAHFISVDEGYVTEARAELKALVNEI